ncbi:DNA-formamidopyrimidine glycosylase family protein [Sulfuriflexus sp.]|uniref:DNA-formamidopyrimidine glycosylase family protein n=1 Tax=Sulfuriflexus sp. TaxID=2015443 RepID=UPI00391F560E
MGRAFRHHSFHSVDRHGKYPFIDTGNKWLVMHFGMTSHIRYFQVKWEMPDVTRLFFIFEKGSWSHRLVLHSLPASPVSIDMSRCKHANQ